MVNSNCSTSENTDTRRASSRCATMQTLIIILVVFMTLVGLKANLFSTDQFYNGSTIPQKKENEDKHERSEIESCLQPRTNYNVAVKSLLKPPCEFSYFI